MISRITLIIFFIVLLAITVSATPAVTNVALGGSNQDRDRTVSSLITITNTNTVGDISINSLTPAPTVDPKYKVVIKGTSTQLTVPTPASPIILIPGGSLTLTVEGYVPFDFNAVDNDLKETAFSIGSLLVSYSENSVLATTASDLTMQAKNMLKLNRGNIKISGSTSSEKSFREGTRVDSIKPGDKLTIEVEVENLFSKSTDVNFDDVEVTLEFDDDEDFDINQKTGRLSIDAGDEERLSFGVDVEDDARDRGHSLDVFISGADDNNAKHGQKIRVNLDIERDPHDLVIMNVELQPSVRTCDAERSVQASVSLINRGRVDEDEAVAEISIPALSVNEKTSAFSIDENDTETVSLSFMVDHNAGPGVYSGNVFTYYDLTNRNNVKPISFTINDCTTNNLVQYVNDMIITIYTPNRNNYLIDFTNQVGLKYTIPYLSNSFGNVHFGYEDKKLHFTESQSPDDFFISPNSYFILSNVNSPRQNNQDSRVVKYESIDTISKQLTFRDLATGLKQVAYTGNTRGTTYLDINNIRYQILVDARTGNLSMDLNGDGNFDKSTVIIGTERGVLLNLGNSNNLQSPTLTLSAGNEVFTIPFTLSSDKIGIDVSKITGVQLDYLPYDPNFAEGKSDSGSFFRLYDPSSLSINLEELTITFYKTLLPSSSFNVNKNITASVINPFTVEVTSVRNGLADDVLENGMRFGFQVTVPDNEPNLIMWVSDWTALTGNHIIPSKGNSFIKYKNNYYTVGSIFDYSESQYFTVTDENLNIPGLQASFELLVKLPLGSQAGDYTANFGIKSFST